MTHRRHTWLLVGALIALLLIGAQNTTGAQTITTIEFWHAYPETGPAHTTLITDLIPRFEAEHSGVRVQSVAFPEATFRAALLTALAQGDGPDVARLDALWIGEFADLGLLAPLDVIMPGLETYAGAVFPGSLATNIYNNQTYGLPLDASTRVFAYNPVLYESAGLASPPRTIIELTVYCGALRNYDDDLALFEDNGTGSAMILPWLWSMDGAISDTTFTTTTGYLNSATTVAVYTFLAELAQDECFGPALLDPNQNATTNFFAGTTATLLAAPSLYPAAEAQPEPLSFAPETTLIPTGSGGSVSVVDGHSIVVIAGGNPPMPDEQLQAALDFLRFAQSDAYQLTLAGAGYLPVKPALGDSAAMQDHPYFGVFLAQMATARARPVHPAWEQIDEILADTGQRILRGEDEPQTALDDAAAQIDLILAEYR